MSLLRALLPVAWLAAGLLLPACGSEPAPPEPAPPTLSAPEVEPPPPSLSAPPPPTASGGPAPRRSARPAETVLVAPHPDPGSPGPAEPALLPLENLLRLPGAAPGEPASQPLRLPPSEDAPVAKGEKPKPRQVQVELRSRKDTSLIDRNKARTRTDAGVAVDLGGDTKLRTGVRVEQETGLEREEPTPTVGIERRF